MADTFDERGVMVNLTSVLQGALPLSEIIPIVGETLVSSIEKNFMEGGRYSSPGSWRGGATKWEPLKRATVRRRGEGARILQHSGLLAKSFFWRPFGTTVQITNNRRYFAIHQFGGTIQHPGGTPYIVIGGRATFLKKNGAYPDGVKFTQPHAITIPARPMLVVQDEDIVEIRDAVAEVVQRRIGE